MPIKSPSAPPIEPLQAREAFEAYYTLPPDKRPKLGAGCLLIAKELSLRPATVKTWASRFKWAARTAARDAEVMDIIASENVKSSVETKLYYHKKLHLLAKKWFDTLFEGDEAALKVKLSLMKVSDIRAVIDLDLSLCTDQQLIDYLKGTKADEHEAKEQAKNLSTEQLQKLASLDSPRPKNKPVAIGSGQTGTGSA